MTDNQFLQLAEAAAERLTGRRVLLRLRLPPTHGATGEAYRATDAPRLILIDIAPALTLRRRYEVLLHETAHAALGHVDQVKPTPANLEQSAAIRLPAAYWQTEHAADPWETAAQAQADKWQAWAEREAARYDRPGDPDSAKIIVRLTLLGYYEDKKP